MTITPSSLATVDSAVLDGQWVRVAALNDVQARGVIVVSTGRHGLALFYHDDRVYAVDNRCPHMGFPLSRGSCRDGILTCHWHHARFDLQSGGTFDPFADDVRAHPTRIVDGAVWVDLDPASTEWSARWKARLRDGLEQNLSLVIAKSVLALLEAGVPAPEIMDVGGQFGTIYRGQGWGPGLTILTALGNVFPVLAPEDRMLALYHGHVHVANDCAGQPPRFALDALPLSSGNTSPDRLTTWFRRFIEVRDSQGAERVLLTAVDMNMAPAQIAGMLFAACTDHFFLAGGHTLDFTNKACEMLDAVGWSQAGTILPSLLMGMAGAVRAEEQNSWRYPIDLIALLAPVLGHLNDMVSVADGGHHDSPITGPWQGFDPLVDILLADDPAATLAALVASLNAGARLAELSETLCYAAALRMARFHTSNEFDDWITVLHTFTYCNALHQALRRHPSPDLARGLFHGAMKIYLDRFLNMPVAKLPNARSVADLPADGPTLLTQLTGLLDMQSQVNEAGSVVYRYLSLGLPVAPLLAVLGHLLLREDAEFHSYQALEAGIRHYSGLQAKYPAQAVLVLVGVARYLAAHSPTSRAMLQTARSALRLYRGEDLSATEPEEDATPSLT